MHLLLWRRDVLRRLRLVFIDAKFGGEDCSLVCALLWLRKIRYDKDWGNGTGEV
jgi:hypothetical protein